MYQHTAQSPYTVCRRSLLQCVDIIHICLEDIIEAYLALISSFVLFFYQIKGVTTCKVIFYKFSIKMNLQYNSAVKIACCNSKFGNNTVAVFCLPKKKKKQDKWFRRWMNLIGKIQHLIKLNMCFFFSSALCVQALREPAAFAKSTGCESEIPQDKLTIAQARRGTPGHTSIVFVSIANKCHATERNKGRLVGELLTADASVCWYQLISAAKSHLTISIILFYC